MKRALFLALSIFAITLLSTGLAAASDGEPTRGECFGFIDKLRKSERSIEYYTKDVAHWDEQSGKLSDKADDAYEKMHYSISIEERKISDYEYNLAIAQSQCSWDQPRSVHCRNIPKFQKKIDYSRKKIEKLTSSTELKIQRLQPRIAALDKKASDAQSLLSAEYSVRDNMQSAIHYCENIYPGFPWIK